MTTARSIFTLIIFIMETLIVTLFNAFIAIVVFGCFLVVWSLFSMLSAAPIRRLLGQWYSDDMDVWGDFLFIITHAAFVICAVLWFYLAMSVLWVKMTLFMRVFSTSLWWICKDILVTFYMWMSIMLVEWMSEWTFLEIWDGEYTYYGTVVEHNWRYLTIRTLDNYLYLVPNTFLFWCNINQYSDEYRLYIKYPFHYGMDISEGEASLREWINRSPLSKYFDTESLHIATSEFADSVIVATIMIVMKRDIIKADWIPIYLVRLWLQQDMRKHMDVIYGSYHIGRRALRSCKIDF